MKGTIDIRRVSTPAEQRLVASFKRTLRRRSVRAARSVWSRPLSRVIESRNVYIVEVSLLGLGGTAPCRALVTKCGTARPGSESGAEGRVDVSAFALHLLRRDRPGTWENLYFPVRKITGIGRSRTQTPRTASGVSAAAVNKNAGTDRVPGCKREASAPGSNTGSLSRLIVALESRETLSGGSL